jgi:signal transduction histidine kinase
MDLESHQFISFFAHEQAAQLCDVAVIESFQDGTVIFDEGDGSQSIYLILDGRVIIRRRVSGDEYKILTEANTNNFFGEMGIFDGQPRSAQAIVCEGATLAQIPAHELMQVLDSITGREAIKVFSYIAQRLRESTDEIIHKTKMESVGEMINTIIHDFRSPLSSINLASSMIKEQHPDEDTVEFCELIRDQVRRMEAMAGEFLEFARGEGSIQRNSIDVASNLQQFERLIRDFLHQSKVQFKIDCPEKIIIVADDNKLIRVWQNLVNNAVDSFRSKGGFIDIGVSADAGWVTVTIRDNGPGIPESIRDRLFEPFVTYGKGGGTGLGTAITKSIVEAYGGTISFESSLNVGTTFYIRFPRQTLAESLDAALLEKPLLDEPLFIEDDEFA